MFTMVKELCPRDKNLFIIKSLRHIILIRSNKSILFKLHIFSTSNLNILFSKTDWNGKRFRNSMWSSLRG
jgi:hypothetical protein